MGSFSNNCAQKGGECLCKPMSSVENVINVNKQRGDFHLKDVNV
jgi:hypothetical protein